MPTLQAIREQATPETEAAKPMSQQSTKVRAHGLAGAALAAVVALVAPNGWSQSAYAASASPFSALAGSWSGAGTMAVPDGPRERIRCRATYTVAPSGLELHQELRCASDSYRFDVSSSLVYKGGQVVGTWTERTRKASGRVSGSATGNEIRATVQGSGFSASLLLVTRGSRQTLAIRTDKADLPSFSIDLRQG
jgi:hypothetical protein